MARVIEGDCVEKMRELPPESIDAIVCDPPYGLEFMGKEWDSIRPTYGNWNDAKWAGKGLTRKEGKATSGRPSGVGSLTGATPSLSSKQNLKCRNCGHWQSGGTPCQCGAPDWQPRPNERAWAQQEWHEAWATEALRVLKPGGHLLAFGGTRTYHRLACAVEDAGFEIRDSLIWLYGSGFPKSLDVSKAIDKAAGRGAADTEARYAQVFAVTRWLRGQIEARGVSSAAINEHFGASNIAQEWLMVEMGAVKRPRVPTWEQWSELRQWLDLPNEQDTAVWALNGQKGTPAPLAFEREKKKYDHSHSFAQAGLLHGAQKSHTATSQVERQGYAEGPGSDPATPEAAQWEGWGTALKPGHEPIVVGRKPLTGTVAGNVLEHGTGALNIDGCRVGATDKTKFPVGDYGERGLYGVDGERTDDPNPAGRWPANVLLSHLPECVEVGTRKVKVVGATAHQKHHGKGQMLNPGEGQAEHPGYADPDGTETVTAYECAEGCPVAALDEQSGERQAGARPKTANVNGPLYERGWQAVERDERVDMGSGGASRFYYTAKASRAERNAGLDGFEAKDWADNTAPTNTRANLNTSTGEVRNPRASRNHHPTVKPIDLMRWLVRLVTPPGGTILDPFLGSGTTGCAAVLEGFDFIGIEREAEYAAIAEARIAWWAQRAGQDTTEALIAAGLAERIQAEHDNRGQIGLFDEVDV